MRRVLPLIPALLVGVSSARAEDTNYQNYVLGGRAVGLGGAFTALADDPSGILYNPAGLVDALEPSLQVSTNLYGVEVTSSGDVFGELAGAVTDLDNVFAQLNIIPSTAGAVDAFGKRMPSGAARHAYGLGVFVPSFRSFALETSGPARTAGQRLAYQRSVLDRTLQAGAAYAYRLDRVFSFGLSVFGVYRALRELEETSLFDEGEVARAFTSAESSLSLYTISLVVSAGVKAKLSDRWSLGATVFTPSVSLMNAATLRVVQSEATPGSDASYRVDAYRDLPADTKTGASVRLGVAHTWPGRALLAVDLTLHGPTEYELFSLPADSPVGNVLTIQRRIERRTVANLNAGFEWQFEPWLFGAAGLFTNFSSAPSIPGEAQDRLDRDHLPQLHGVGNTLVLGFLGDNTLTRAGLLTSYAFGSDVLVQQAELRPIGSGGDFKKVDRQSLSLFVFVSSTFWY